MQMLIISVWQVTHTFLMEEEILETSLIVVLVGISCWILKATLQTLQTYERAVKQAGEERSRLLSRLTEAFSYLGTINVELQQVHSILCGIERYPKNKKEWKRLFESLTATAMTVGGTRWALVRILNRKELRTVKEFCATRPEAGFPSSTIGNREIIEGRSVPGCTQIRSSPKDLDWSVVCILPESRLSEKENILITGIMNQIELFYMLYRSGFLNSSCLDLINNGRNKNENST
jgi:hypothetical protein